LVHPVEKVKRAEVLKLVIDAHLLSKVSSRYDSSLQASANLAKSFSLGHWCSGKIS
jgi:hypothetical protein